MKIYVVSHKLFRMPMNDSMYCPIWVGGKKETKVPDGWCRDDLGENISARNSHYCELTALYWIWKHGTDEIEGLCHYRRYFVTPFGKFMNILFHKQGGFLREKQIKKMLQHCDLIRHNPTFFKEGIRKQYEKNHSAQDLRVVEQIIRERHPAYVEAFETVMNGYSIHLLNMMIAPKNILDAYSEWLFDILFEYEKQVGMTESNRRVMGFLAERLLDVWVLGKGLKAKDCFTLNTERIDLKIVQ